MAQLQIRSKSKQLQEKGCQVHQYGSRSLEEGGFGQDVAALQQFLSEQAYFNAGEGFSGYFGSVTREALSDWQRDSGLEVTGTFNTASQLEYLRQKEASLQSSQSVQEETHAAADPSPSPLTAAAPAVQLVVPSAAAAPLAFQHWGTPWSMAGTLAAGAGLLVLALALLSKHVVMEKLQGLGTGAKPPLPVRYPEEEEAGPAVEAPPRSISRVDGTVFVPGQKRTEPLTDEELQHRIAMLKGKSPRSLPVQRSAPKPLPGGAGEGPSRYGHYYGGKAVYNQVKQLLVVEGSGVDPPSLGVPAASQRGGKVQASTAPVTVVEAMLLGEGGGGKDTVVLSHRPVQLHKPARLARR